VFDWNDARYFLAVSRLGSLSAAARHLRVQQSTVGRRLAALETALDTRLFDRTSDGYVATAAGEALMAHAERIEDEALAVERRLAGRQGQIAGQVRVTAPQTFGFSFLIPLLAQLRREQPDILVELIADNFALNLSRREADLALRAGRPRQPQLVTRKLGILADGLYATRDYVAAHGPLRAAEVAAHDFVTFDETYPHTVEVAWATQKLRGARCVLRVNGTPGIVTAVRAGVGIGLVPCYIGERDETLVRVWPELLFHELWLVMHRDLRHAARIRVVAEFFVRELARAAPLLEGRPATTTTTTKTPRGQRR
jgi:DNA-binding transcriptional LysR family regulator